MAGLKKFKMGGVDLKSNDLIRDPMRASNLRNVIRNQKGDIDKAPGHESVETVVGEFEKEIYYKSGNQSVIVMSDGTLKKLYNGARQDCSIATLYANAGLTVKNRIISAEYLSNIYFTTSDGNSDVLKYDGGNMYRAGLPAPASVFAGTASTISSPGTGYFYRFFYSHKDLNGNITFGPYKQLTSTVNNATITVSSFKTANPYGKFFNKYLTIPNALQNIGPLATTLNYTATNYVVGDKFLLDPDGMPEITISSASGKTFVALTITSIAAGVITFSATDFGDVQSSISPTGADFNIDNRTKLHIYRSDNESFGYKNVSNSVFNTYLSSEIINNSQDNFTSTAHASADPSGFFEDVYNEDGQKLMPPKCKFITEYGDQLIYANIVGVYDQVNFFTQYNNDDLIIPSDIGNADNGENNSANIQKIGNSYDGSITGIKRCNDLLIVTKDNSIHALDGVIQPGAYSLRRIPTNYIGCLSHNSIIEVEGGILLNGNDGIYFVDGSSCRPLSENIDPFFNTILAERTIASVNSGNKRHIFYMTDGVTHYNVIFDYYAKEWFIWEGIDMSKGLYQANDKSLHFAKSTKLYKLNTSYSADGTAITGYYATNWEDLREPSVVKKFKSVRFFNLSAVDTTFTVRFQKNWKDTDITANTITVTVPAYSSVQKMFDQLSIHALRMIFQNSTLNQNMVITGYELEYEPIQKSDKGN